MSSHTHLCCLPTSSSPRRRTGICPCTGASPKGSNLWVGAQLRGLLWEVTRNSPKPSQQTSQAQHLLQAELQPLDHRVPHHVAKKASTC